MCLFARFNFFAELDYSVLAYPLDDTGSTYIPTILAPTGLCMFFIENWSGLRWFKNKTKQRLDLPSFLSRLETF